MTPNKLLYCHSQLINMCQFARILGGQKMRMALAWRFGVLLTILAIVSTSALESLIKGDFMHCETLVKNWAVSSFDNEIEEDKQILKDLLFFLHIPRTGGRTYFHCFLRKLYTSDQECPRSYDKLRVDPSKPNCRLLVTHDDYSMMSKLPKERTSVVTILRNPIDRVFSTYEFSVEVAARFLVHPNLTSATQMSGRIRPKSRAISTLDIWPWKYLVPWMREDLFVRRDARKLGEFVGVYESSDSYNMEEIAMPLHAFINHPIALDIIHNGATFQVAGLTNNSFLAESHEIRQCVRQHTALGQYVLEVAKRRLDNMLYVGLTEDHKKSATMFANMVGAQVLSQSESLNSHAVLESSNRTELSSSMVESEPDGSNELQSSNNGQKASEVPSPNAVEGVNENMTVGKLMEAYEVCISSLRKSQAGRRTISLKRISPANFSKESRLLVPDMVLQQILSLNSLDVALYKHAQDIFAQQQRHLVHKLGTEKSKLSDSYRYWHWKLFLLSVTGLLFTALTCMIVSTARRTSKLKV